MTRPAAPARLPGGPCLVVAVGPAASGKSTLLRALLAAGDVDELVDTDVVRAEHGLGAAERERTYALTEQRVRRHLLDDLRVALDATNLTTDTRDRWYRAAKETGATVALVAMPVLDLGELTARDAARDRHVPEDVIALMHEQQRNEATVSVLRYEGEQAARVYGIPVRVVDATMLGG